MNARSFRPAFAVVLLTALAPFVGAHEHDAAATQADRAATAPRPTTDSVYQLPVALTDQTGRTFRLDERSGRPVSSACSTRRARPSARC